MHRFRKPVSFFLKKKKDLKQTHNIWRIRKFISEENSLHGDTKKKNSSEILSRRLNSLPQKKKAHTYYLSIIPNKERPKNSILPFNTFQNDERNSPYNQIT